MSSPVGYAPLAYKSLVAFKHGAKQRIAYVLGHELDTSRKPGVSRVVYCCQPCTITDGKPDSWFRMFKPVFKRALEVTPVTMTQAAEMLSKGDAKDWK